MRVSARRSSAPRLAACSTSFSDLITSSVAMPAAIARSFFAKVEPCTTARSIWLKILSKILLRVSSAPTGTWPPDNALDSSTMSGSTFQCSTARNRPVQPMIGMGAVDDAGTTGRASRELDRRFYRFRAGIGEKHLVQIRHIFQKALGEHTRQSRDVELHQIGQVAVEHALQCRPQRWMVA